MKSSPNRVFIYAFLATFLIFSFMKSDISPKKKLLDPIIARFLSEKSAEEMVENMCKQSSSELETFYKESGYNYTFTPKSENDFLNELLMKFANGSRKFDIETDEIVDYSKKNALYIVLIVLFVLLILFWIPYIICVCTRCCCCIPESCADNRNVFLVLALILSVAVMVCTFIGYSKNTNVLHGIFGFGCTILKIENHLVHGDEYTKDNLHWKGLTKIIDKLYLTNQDLEIVGDNATRINNYLTSTEELFTSTKKDIEDEWTDKKDKKVTNPNPNSAEKSISPTYLSLYGPETNEHTTLGVMDIALTEVKKQTLDQIKNIFKVIDINAELEKIEGNINKTVTELNNTVTKIESSIVSKIGDYYDKFDELDSSVRKVMNIFFSLNLALVIFFAVSIVLLLCCKFGGIFICIGWFFIYIFMLLSVLCGFVFGLIGSFTKDASSAAKYLTDNIQKINYKEINILDICINGNGSLAQTDLIPINFDTSIVDDIFNLEKNITNGINDIKQLNFSFTKANEELYNQFLTKPKTYVGELVTSLDEIKIYINSNTEGSVVDSSTPIYDRWEITKEECGDDYYYPSENNLRNLLLEDGEIKKRCLVVTEWTTENIKNEYSGIKSSKEGVIISDEVEKYHKALFAFMTNHAELINGMIQKNEKFGDSFNEIKNNEIYILENITQTIRPLRTLYKEITGEGSIFDIMNCKFIKRDINKVFDVLYNEFGGSFKTTSDLFIIISGCELGLTFLVLIIMKVLKASATQIPNYSAYSNVKN